MKQAEQQFLKTYPLALKELLFTPCLFAYVYQQQGESQLWPAVKGLKQFAQAFGHSDAAIRTSLSRAKKEKLLDIKTINQRKQAILGGDLQYYANFFIKKPYENNSFSLLLFHFSTAETQKRNALKDILNRYHYVMLTQNAYLRYGGQPEALDALLAKQGLDSHIYHFHGLSQLPSRLLAEIETLYQTPYWSQRITQAVQDVKGYLSLDPLDSEAGYLRYLYARVAFHKHILTQAPHLPESLFPDVAETQRAYRDLLALDEVHHAAFLQRFHTYFA